MSDTLEVLKDLAYATRPVQDVADSGWWECYVCGVSARTAEALPHREDCSWIPAATHLRTLRKIGVLK